MRRPSVYRICRDLGGSGRIFMREGNAHAKAFPSNLLSELEYESPVLTYPNDVLNVRLL